MIICTISLLSWQAYATIYKDFITALITF